MSTPCGKEVNVQQCLILKWKQYWSLSRILPTPFWMQVCKYLLSQCQNERLSHKKCLCQIFLWQCLLCKVTQYFHVCVWNSWWWNWWQHWPDLSAVFRHSCGRPAVWLAVLMMCSTRSRDHGQLCRSGLEIGQSKFLWSCCLQKINITYQRTFMD